MALSLSKGNNLSLTKEAGSAGLAEVTVGLGWNVRTTTGSDFDLDAQAIGLGVDGKVLTDNHFVYFNNMSSPDGVITLSGDNLTGAGEGDDETITIKLASAPAELDKVVVIVAIYDADARKQSFGMVNGAFIRVVNNADGLELARYDLTEDASGETAMVLGELYRKDTEWKFKAVGQGYASGLRGIAMDYGVNV